LRFAATAGQSRGMTRKLENLTIRLEPETREALERLAVREDRPLAYLIRRVLRAEAPDDSDIFDGGAVARIDPPAVDLDRADAGTR
jgi:Ribbon-helix-helix protein, copG family